MPGAVTLIQIVKRGSHCLDSRELSHSFGYNHLRNGNCIYTNPRRHEFNVLTLGRFNTRRISRTFVRMHARRSYIQFFPRDLHLRPECVYDLVQFAFPQIVKLAKSRRFFFAVPLPRSIPPDSPWAQRDFNWLWDNGAVFAGIPAGMVSGFLFSQPDQASRAFVGHNQMSLRNREVVVVVRCRLRRAIAEFMYCTRIIRQTEWICEGFIGTRVWYKLKY